MPRHCNKKMIAMMARRRSEIQRQQWGVRMKKKLAEQNAFLIHCLTYADEVKDKFYEELDTLVTAVPKSEILILLGDFNARVDTDLQTWNGVIGPHGWGKCNSNGLLLLKMFSMHDPLITNTFFRLPTRNRTSWIHPRSKHWHRLRYH